MYQSHPYITTPPDDTMVWHYMPWWKFERLVGSASLFFARLDRYLPEDPNEGAVPEPTKKRLLDQLEHLPDSEVITRKVVQDGIEPWTRKAVYASCWSDDSHESAKMWRKFGRGPESVALQSTVGRLKDALRHEKLDVYIAPPKYQSLHYGSGRFFALLQFAFRKDLRWSPENEVRAAIVLTPPKAAAAGACREGYSATVDLNCLFEHIYVHPRADAKFQARVDSHMLAHGLTLRCNPSALGSTF
jgi:hypothetical protein